MVMDDRADTGNRFHDFFAAAAPLLEGFGNRLQ